MLWRNWNDQLSLLLMMGIPALWAVNRWIPLPSEVNGALIVVWTLVAQFYFRKKETEA